MLAAYKCTCGNSFKTTGKAPGDDLWNIGDRMRNVQRCYQSKKSKIVKGRNGEGRKRGKTNKGRRNRWMLELMMVFFALMLLYKKVR